MAWAKDQDATHKSFEELVNITATALEKHLRGEASQSSRQRKYGPGDATGHEEGGRIVEMLHKSKFDFLVDD